MKNKDCVDCTLFGKRNEKHAEALERSYVAPVFECQVLEAQKYK